MIIVFDHGLFLCYNTLMRRLKIKFISGSVLSVALVFIFYGLTLAAPPSTAQEERSHEILQKDQELRAKIEEGEKVFIEKIVVKGASALSKEQLDKLVSPFEKQWLSQDDIAGLEDAIRQLYIGKGHKKNPSEISSQISQDVLEITVKEQ